MVPEHWKLVAVQTRTVPNRLYAEVFDALATVSAVFRRVTGYDLCVIGWQSDVCFIFRNPQLSANKANTVMVELNNAFQQVDANWGVWSEGPNEFYCGYSTESESDADPH